MLCVESGYEYNCEVFFFLFSSKVTDRELTLAKCKLKLLYKRSWIRGLKFPSSMHELAGTFKVKIKTATPTGQLRLQKPANRVALFTSNFSLSKSFLRRGYGILPNPKINQKQHSQMKWLPTGHVGSFSNSTLRRVGKSIRLPSNNTVQCIVCCTSSFRIDI